MQHESKHQPIDEVKTVQPPHKKSEVSVPTGKSAYKDAIRLFIKMLVTIFVCEAAIMALLHILPRQRGWEIVLDPLLLTIVGTPILYWLLVRPIWLALEQRNHAVEILLESEEKHRTLFETMSQGVVYQDACGQIISANPAAERILGLTLDEMKGRTSADPLWRSIHEDCSDFPGEKHPSMISLKTGNPEKGVLMGILNPNDEQYHWININSVPLFRKGEKKPYKVYTTFEDITERKEAEESLRESEARYKAVIDNAQEGIVVVQDKVLKFVNPTVISIMDYTEEELTFRPFIEFVHPEDRDHVMKIHLKRFKMEEVPEVYEFRICDKQNNIIWLESNGILMDWNGGPATLNFLRDITERKQIEDALLESEDKYRSIFEIAANLITSVNEEGVIVDCNNRVREVLGYEREEIIGHPMSKIIHPDCIEKAHENLDELMSTGYSYNKEYKMVRKDGRLIDVCINSSGLKDENGQYSRSICIIDDITERKKAEKELSKHRYYLEKAQNIGKIGTWELDIEKNILIWTDENYRIFGIPKGTDLTYEIFLDCVHPDDREYVNKKWKAALNKEPYDIEHRLLVDGEIRWVREKAEQEFDDKGNCIRAIGFTQDITEHKRTDELLQHNANLLRYSQKVARLGYYTLDIPADSWESSDILDSIFGIEEDYDRSTEGWLQIVHPKHREEMSVYLSEHVVGQGQSFDREYMIIRASDRQVKWVHGLGRLEFDKEGRPIRMIGTIQDVTDRKKAEEQLLEYQAKLKSLASQLSIIEERERRRIATELHDQIGQTLVFSKLKLDELQQTTGTSEFTKALNEISNNIDKVIQDTRTLTFDLSSPVLNEIGFETAVSEWLEERIQEQHGINIEFEDDGQTKQLDDDIRSLLFRNIRELLINVVKHAQASNVKVSVSKVNSQICVSVEDDGVGIEFTDITSLASENGGFGIFSIKERLEQLGGRLEIDSEKGRGSKITMTAPLKLTKAKYNLQNS
ncbi:MAG: PAS domain S-box protein [Sedimentisphaerales bacterium]|nr:PAS domain S-box protein [Sedimentisphaerales bacterium]